VVRLKEPGDVYYRKSGSVACGQNAKRGRLCPLRKTSGDVKEKWEFEIWAKWEEW
jgi:hypothetical protein|tara:strand:- start:751 stop:915 length:165 start_codon:yes stop_codon:yes gene_type:complete